MLTHLFHTIQEDDFCDSRSNRLWKWVVKLARYVRIGSNVTEMRNGRGMIVGFLSQSTSDFEFVCVETFLNGALASEEKRKYSEKLLSGIASALAIRGKWHALRDEPTSKLVESYLSLIVSTPLEVYDLVLCGGLLGGGMLHFPDGTIQPVHTI